MARENDIFADEGGPIFFEIWEEDAGFDLGAARVAAYFKAEAPSSVLANESPHFSLD